MILLFPGCFGEVNAPIDLGTGGSGDLPSKEGGIGDTFLTAVAIQSRSGDPEMSWKRRRESQKGRRKGDAEERKAYARRVKRIKELELEEEEEDDFSELEEDDLEERDADRTLQDA